jgi:hypothetical protein
MTVEIPRDDTWNEWLRYLVQRLPPYDESTEFLVGVWSYLLKYEAITSRQREFVHRHIAAVCERDGLEIVDGNVRRKENTKKKEGNVVYLKGGE